MEEIFDDEFNFYEVSFDLEYRYGVYYSERLKRIDRKNKQEISKKLNENNLLIQKNIQKNRKIELKNEKKSEKISKIKEIDKFKTQKLKKEREK